jgi:hypothetical protein
MLAPSARGQRNRQERTKLHLSGTTRIFAKIVLHRVSGRGAVGDMSFRAIGLLAALVSTSILPPHYAFAASEEAQFHSGNHRPVSVTLLAPSDGRLGAEYSYNRTVERVSSSEFGRIASVSSQGSAQCIGSITFGDVLRTAISPLSTEPGTQPLATRNTGCFFPFANATKQIIATHKTALTFEPTRSITLRVGGSYVRRATTEESFFLGTKIAQYETVSEGWGDTAFEVIATPVSNENQQIDVSVGATAPTGRINARSKVGGIGFVSVGGVLFFGPFEYDGRPLFPAAFQIGSGTTDILLGAAMRQHLGSLTVGGSWNSTLRTGHSANLYRLGDVTTGTVWSSYEWLDGLSTTLSVAAEHTGRLDLKSRDRQSLSRLTEEINSGATRVDAAIGVNLYGTSGTLAGTGVSIEYRRPLSQSNNGVQMERQSDISLRWSYFR